jgi:hypothetical protein
MPQIAIAIVYTILKCRTKTKQKLILNFFLSLNSDEQYNNWTPDSDYYIGLLDRLVSRIDQVGSPPDFDPFGLDWRFMEFSNAVNLSLYATCVEILTLPVPPELIAEHLINTVINLESPIAVDILPKVRKFVIVFELTSIKYEFLRVESKDYSL